MIFMFSNTIIINNKLKINAINNITTIKITTNDSSLLSKVIGTCGYKAFKAGYHQKIFSYSLYGNNSYYFRGLSTIITSIKTLFPGWLVRIYTNQPNSSQLKSLEKEFNETLFICDVRNLPPPLLSIEDKAPMLWRFTPLGDEQVDVMNVRDTDSLVKNSLLYHLRKFSPYCLFFSIPLFNIINIMI